MAGIPPQRDRLAPGPGDGLGRPRPPPPLKTAARRREAAWPFALVAILLAAATARQALASTGAGPLIATYGFSFVLLAVYGAARLRAAPEPDGLGVNSRAILAGATVAVLLLAPGLWLRAHGHPTRVDEFGAGFFVQFVPALLWVAPAEELVLRGVLQPQLRRALGPGAAILAVGVLFAAIHLPVYGWSAMPLDLGVGILLGWLREETRSVAACVTAHTLADLGSWFLA